MSAKNNNIVDPTSRTVQLLKSGDIFGQYDFFIGDSSDLVF